LVIVAIGSPRRVVVAAAGSATLAMRVRAALAAAA